MSIMDNVTSFTKEVGTKAKNNYDAFSKNNEISQVQKQLNEMFAKLGRAYYEKHSEDPDWDYLALVDEIKKTEEKIM